MTPTPDEVLEAVQSSGPPAWPKNQHLQHDPIPQRTGAPQEGDVTGTARCPRCAGRIQALYLIGWRCLDCELEID